jgi:hypothetical protein
MKKIAVDSLYQNQKVVNLKSTIGIITINQNLEDSNIYLLNGGKKDIKLEYIKELSNIILVFNSIGSEYNINFVSEKYKFRYPQGIKPMFTTELNKKDLVFLLNIKDEIFITYLLNM